MFASVLECTNHSPLIKSYCYSMFCTAGCVSNMLQICKAGEGVTCELSISITQSSVESMTEDFGEGGDICNRHMSATVWRGLGGGGDK